MANEQISCRLRVTLAEYNGDREAFKRDLAATANMVSSIAVLLGKSAIPLLRLAEVTNAEHSDLYPTQGVPQ